MALDNLDLITVTGTWILANGNPGEGTVTFTPEVILIDPATDEIVLPVAFTVTLDATGSISVQLPATDDPDLVPVNWVYRVVENIGTPALKNRVAYNLSVPHDGGPIDLSDVVIPGPDGDPQFTYATLAELRNWVPVEGTPGHVLTLAPEGGGVWAPGGGGGGGAVDSVNGQTGVVVLNAGHVGAAPAVHTHAQSDITGLATALGGKANTSHTHAQGDITGLTTTLSNKSDVGHTHDDRYYTEAEVDTALSAKANTSHTHGIGDVTGLQSALDGKAASSHTHAAGDITSGTFADARIPSLNASKVNAGTFGVARGGTGVATVAAGSYLRGNGTSAMQARTPAEVRGDIEAPRIVNTDSQAGRTIFVGATAPGSPVAGDIRIRPSGA